MKKRKYLSIFIIFSSLFSFAASKNEDRKVNERSREIINIGAIGSLAEAPVPKLFEKILALNKARIGNSGQILLATNERIGSKNVTIQTFEKINGQWVEKFGITPGTVGVYGFARYKEKKEGDKKTPSGVFYLGPVYTSPVAKVTTKMVYWIATDNDYWIDDVNSPQYNRWVTSSFHPTKTYKVSCEDMNRKQDGKYKYGIAVQYNMDQIKGKGSVITVHILEGDPEGDKAKPTLGCVAIPEEELIEIIGWLDPAKKPLIIMGTEEELLTKPVSGATLDNNDKYIWKKETYIPPAK